jgi:hypothetical protein
MRSALQVEELQRSGGCGRMGAVAADITWRYLTWEDSVAKVTASLPAAALMPPFHSVHDPCVQVLALLRCRLPPVPTNCSVYEGAYFAAPDLSCWFKFSHYHRAVGLALLSAAHAREAAHHFSTAAVALARVTSLEAPADWGELRELAMLMAACSALVPQMPLSVDRLMQFVNRLGVSPSHPLPPLSRRLCEPVRPSSASHQKPMFSPFVAAAALAEDAGSSGADWAAFIEGAGLDAAVALLTSATSGEACDRGARLLRMQRLVGWIRRSGIVMHTLL